MNRCTLTSVKLCLFMPAEDRPSPSSFLINKNYAKKKVQHNFTAMILPEIQVAPLTQTQVFAAWFIFSSFPNKLLLSSAWSKTTVKINIVYFLPTEEDFFLPFLPFDGATQKKKLLFIVESPGKMTQISESYVHIQHNSLFSISLEY